MHRRERKIVRLELNEASDAEPRIQRLAGGRPLTGRFRNGVVALGNFDGFHLGHQAVIAQAAALAQARGVATIVATFDPHPVCFFRPDTTSFRLTTLDQLQMLIGGAGVDAMIVFRFDQMLAQATPDEFVRMWLRNVGAIVTGANFSFGKGRAGDTELLCKLAGQYAMSAHAVACVERDGEVVSSSRVRAALRGGDCTTAARLLTRPFAISGVLAPGKRMDPALAMLDASIDLNDYLRPRPGVYAVRVRVGDTRELGGSAYLGPAAAGEKTALELFLVGLTKNDFGAAIRVELIAHLHDAPDDFAPAAIRKQIVDDMAQASGVLAVAAGLFDR